MYVCMYVCISTLYINEMNLKIGCPKKTSVTTNLSSSGEQQMETVLLHCCSNSTGVTAYQMFTVYIPTSISSSIPATSLPRNKQLQYQSTIHIHYGDI